MQYGYGPPQQPYYQAPRPASTSGTAVASFILSLLGMLGLLPFIGSVIGLILGYNARREIDNSGGALGGRGLASWGIALGWVAIVFLVVGGCIAAVLLLTGIVALPAAGMCAGLENLQLQ